jgi:N6-adenosine-specific RNA methylase IME4
MALPVLTNTSRAVEEHYETMTLDDICALPVSEIAAPNAMLFLCAAGNSQTGV